MLRKTLIAVMLIIFHFNTSGQTFYTLEEVKQFETRLNIQNFLTTLLSYPFESLEKREVGVLIGGIEFMSPGQDDRFFIANSLSKDLDAQLINALKITYGNFPDELRSIATNGQVVVYVIYQIENNDFEISYNKVPEHLTGPLRMTLSDKIWSGNPFAPFSKTISIKPDAFFLENISQINQNLQELGAKYQDRSGLRKRLGDRQIRRQLKKNLENYDELIRRNPFNRALLEQRAALYLRLDETENAARDQAFIRDYLTAPDERQEAVVGEEQAIDGRQ